MIPRYDFGTPTGVLADTLIYTDVNAVASRISGGRTYVSNADGYNLVIFDVAPDMIDDPDDPGTDIARPSVVVRPGSGARKNVAIDNGVGYFRVVSQEASVSDFVADDSSYDGVYEGVHETALAVANAVDIRVLDPDNALRPAKYAGATEEPGDDTTNDADTVDTDEGWEAFRAVLTGESYEFSFTTVAVDSISDVAGVSIASEIDGDNTDVTVNDDDRAEGSIAPDPRTNLLRGIRAREIEAGDGAAISIDGNVTVYVDGRAPEISIDAPANGHLQDSDRVDFEFTVEDDGSGLRSDRERPETGGDTDGISKEPLAAQFGYGADIGVFLADTTTGKFDLTDVPNLGTDLATSLRVDNRGDDDWNEEEEDHEYSVEFRTSSVDNEDGIYQWFILARDRAGNEARYPSDAKKFASVTVDDSGPEVEDDDVFGGIGFDLDDDEEVRDSSSIAIIFANESSHGLDTDTIEIDAFTVEDNEVVDVIHPNNKLTEDDDDKCTSDTGLVGVEEAGDCIDTRNRVYLVLATPLEGDETPEVSISSGQFTDMAGNGNEDADEIEAQDYIQPTLTVTVTGDVSTDGRSLSQEEVTIRVESGEPLRSRPTVWLVSINASGNIDDAGGARSLTAVSGETMAWESEYDAGDFQLADTEGLGAIIVSGEDRASASNVTFTTGWTAGDSDTPDDGDKLSLSKLDGAGLLVEFDNDAPEAVVEVTPNKGDDLVTESANPFIRMTFPEGAEYGKDSITQGTGSKAVKTEVDTYDTITIDSITLDGEDVSGSVVPIGDNEFNLSLRGLSVATYTLEYTASDAAGNSTGTVEEEFEVEERSEYEVKMTPGWNLVSVPANPEDPSIGSVLPDDHPASTVLSYQNGEWVSANRPKLADRTAETSAWSGTLTDITAGYGYFIETDGFDELSTLIPEASPTTQLPTVPVTSGWNLLGVVDVSQGDAGDTSRRADLYLASIEWSVAYGFDTTTNRWQKVVSAPANLGVDSEGRRVVTAAKAAVEEVLDAEGEVTTAAQDAVPAVLSDPIPEYTVFNGGGYWVWATEAGVLVP